MPERVKVVAEAHHDGRKTKGSAGVEVNPGYKAEPDYGVLLVVRSEQGFAPGARGYSHGGVSKFSPDEAREIAAALLAAADEVEALSGHDPVKVALRKLGVLKGDE
jgi:hypothetical protein